MELNHTISNQKQAFELLKETTDFRMVEHLANQLPCTFEVQLLIKQKFPHYFFSPKNQMTELPISEQDELDGMRFVDSILETIELKEKNSEFFARLFESEKQYQLKKLDDGTHIVEDKQHQGGIPRELSVEATIVENPFYFGLLPEPLRSYRLARFAKQHDIRLTVGCRYYNLEWLEWLEFQKQKKRGVR